MACQACPPTRWRRTRSPSRSTASRSPSSPRSAGSRSEVDVIELKENTADGKLVIHKAPGAIKPPTLTLKRAKNSSKALWDWHEAVIQGKLSEARKNGSVVLKSYDGTEVARYNFTNAWVSKIRPARSRRARTRC